MASGYFKSRGREDFSNFMTHYLWRGTKSVGGLAVLLVVITLGLLPAQIVRAEEVRRCFCFDDLGKLTAKNIEQESNFSAQCFPAATQADCSTDKFLNQVSNSRYYDCKFSDSAEMCQKSVETWNEAKATELKKISLGATSSGGVVSKLIPDCALADTVKGDCRNINIFVTLAIKISVYLFSIIGGVSLVMFVYGGFLLVLSEGSEEKITQAKEVLTAVVVGLLIAFGGYLLVTFVGQVVGIDREFRLK